MARRLSWVAGVAGATFLAHLLATILTLSFGAGLSLSNFDGGGETWATRLGHLLNWFHDNVLSQPLHPLERNYPPWSLGRGRPRSQQRSLGNSSCPSRDDPHMASTAIPTRQGNPGAMTWSNAPENNKMQRTSHGLDGGSPLILVLSRRQQYGRELNQRLG